MPRTRSTRAVQPSTPSPGSSLSEVYPDAVRFWDTERNTYTPERVAKASTYVAHWVCPECHHRWQRAVFSFAPRPGCPQCSDRHRRRGLAEVRPEARALWRVADNPGVDFDCIPAYSRQQFRWTCSHGRQFVASPHQLITRKTLCQCSGYNTQCHTVQHEYPELAWQWDETQAVSLPTSTSPRSTKPVPWACDVCEYRWWQSPAEHVVHPQCPNCHSDPRARWDRDTAYVLCGGEEVIMGRSHAIRVLEPLWDTPTYADGETVHTIDLTDRFTQHVWRCRTCFLQFTAPVTQALAGCPSCVAARERGIDTVRAVETSPRIRAEWAGLPYMVEVVAASSSYLAAWVCQVCNTRWESTVQDRTRGVASCPGCAE